jgi:hypothetical protein
LRNAIGVQAREDAAHEGGICPAMVQEKLEKHGQRPGLMLRFVLRRGME